jgi:hypothetical protein
MSGYEEDEEDETGEEVEKTRLVTTLTMWRRLSNAGIGIELDLVG